MTAAPETPDALLAIAPPRGASGGRIASIDTARGLVMLLMPVDHTREFFFDYYLFSPGIWWIGSTMKRSGSGVQILAMYS